MRKLTTLSGGKKKGLEKDRMGAAAEAVYDFVSKRKESAASARDLVTVIVFHSWAEVIVEAEPLNPNAIVDKICEYKERKGTRFSKVKRVPAQKRGSKQS